MTIAATNISRRAVLIGFILFVLLGGCSNEEIGNEFENESIEMLNGTWRVVSFEDHLSGLVELKTEANSWGQDIIIGIDLTKDPKQLSGRNITNEVWGVFEYVSGEKFKLQYLGSTYVAQPVWADKLSVALDGEVNYEVNLFHLKIHYSNNTRTMTLVRID